MPLVGTCSVLEIGLEADAPQAHDPILAVLHPLDGLRGTADPILNGIDLDGSQTPICNQFQAALEVHFVSRPARFLPWNANHDDRLDISDAIRVFGTVFTGAPPSPCAASADANGDDVIDISDPVTLLRYRFWGGPPPAAPYPECGLEAGLLPRSPASGSARLDARKGLSARVCPIQATSVPVAFRLPVPHDTRSEVGHPAPRVRGNPPAGYPTKEHLTACSHRSSPSHGLSFRRSGGWGPGKDLDEASASDGLAA